ncbi:MULTISPECIES: TetR/AcrR family transcriptional regulator [unclassified Streptomyces]|uniref:TetR/AcrR family transcriptional regulator n=1 Tax=unclassified Streptomyces TaxID=2593676 RepID=UPI00278BCF4C|nr:MULTISPECIES: TetR/AcrR family transcriptional regulator [unclassified Streptomyces]
MAEGLRERKKRQTRQQISDIATGLFIERGFDAVTIAEIADTANVSVNTVYNYFPAKEDLFLDRLEGMRERLSRWVRGRDVGESAAAAVLRELRAELEAVSPRMGLMPGIERFMAVVDAAPSLRLRLLGMRYEVIDRLEATLREETGAADDDLLPRLMADQINWLNETAVEFVRRRVSAGGAVEKVSRETLSVLDEVERLLSAEVLNYAVRDA